MTPLLRARNLGCRQEGRSLLAGVDLDVFSGQLVGVIGPNGAGKSTLLHCLNGTRASTGELLVAGRPLADYSPRQAARTVALMHQDTFVDFPFTAREVVMMGRHPHLRRFEAEGAPDHRLVSDALAQTGARPLADHPITRLSGGERQRVLFAKALAQQAPLLLLDEPTASLDLSFQERLFALARQWASGERAVVVAVHDLRLAARHCDALVLLAGGRVVASGSPSQVLTPDHLSRAYGVRVRVYENPITGLLDFHLRGDDPAGFRPHVHVIGGGGSAADLLRYLGDRGYRVTAGVLAPGDTDLQVASVYGMPVITCPPFSAIPEPAFADNRDLAGRADLTVVSSLAFGALNLANLESALGATQLVLVQDSPPETRDFTGGEGLELYRQLAARATVLTGAQFEPWMERWRSSAGLPS